MSVVYSFQQLHHCTDHMADVLKFSIKPNEISRFHKSEMAGQLQKQFCTAMHDVNIKRKSKFE